MAHAAHETQHEFWRPPVPLVAESSGASSPTMAEVCPGCGSEFLFGSHFCHTCGVRRPAVLSAATRADVAVIAGLWQDTVERVQSTLSRIPANKLRIPAWARFLHYHEIRQRVGLSTGSLISFAIGLGCVFGALLVGLLNAKTYADWQAIQFYRAEWLLAATAAFVAGILLKKPSRPDEE